MTHSHVAEWLAFSFKRKTPQLRSFTFHQPATTSYIQPTQQPSTTAQQHNPLNKPPATSSSSQPILFLYLLLERGCNNTENGDAAGPAALFLNTLFFVLSQLTFRNITVVQQPNQHRRRMEILTADETSR